MTITLGSLFDGSGGFPLAGALCGIVPVWASEVEPYPIAVTKSRFPNMQHLGDISKINGAEIDPVDIITFGSPCQDLSVAGKRAGLKHQAKGDNETTRSGLFMEAIRIIKEMRGATNGKQPQFVLFENVPGIFSSNKGQDFRIVLEEFIQIADPSAVVPEVPKGGWPYADSYCGDGWSLACRVFNAQHWGVAQRRRRVYACLDLGGQRARQILFEREGLRGYFEKGQSPWQRASADVEGSIGTNDCQGDYISFHLTQDPISREKSTPCLSSGNSANGQAVIGVCYGVDGYNSTLVGETSSTLGVNCGMSTGRCGVMQPIAFTDSASTLRAEAGAPKHLSDIVGRLVCEKSISNGTMKSNNPHSGCRQVDISKTLDTTNPSPNKNQGGMAVVQPMILFEPRSQDGIPRLHNEIAPTLNTAQGGQRQPCVAFSINNIPKSFNTNSTASLAINNKESSQAYHQSGFAGYTEGIGGTLKASGGDYGGGSENLVTEQRPSYIVRRLTPIECARLQGFPDHWGWPDMKDNFTEEEYHFWLDVRNTHALMNNKNARDYTKKQLLAWYNKLHSDSAEYKMWGNGVALPPTLYCMQGIYDALT